MYVGLCGQIPSFSVLYFLGWWGLPSYGVRGSLDEGDYPAGKQWVPVTQHGMIT